MKSGIRYSTVWEDADTLLRAFRAVPEGGVILSVASAGDNALALLTLRPAQLIALDPQWQQLALLELRATAFALLDSREQVLQFLGVRPTKDRIQLYGKIRPYLSARAGEFWDERPKAISHGIIHCGRFERFLRTFASRILPRIHPRVRIARLIAHEDIAAQARFYHDEWDTRLWRAIFSILFCAPITRLFARPVTPVRSGESFHHYLLSRTERLFCSQLVRDNPYVHYLLTGTYRDDALPAYLRPQYFSVIRDSIDRIKYVHAPMQELTSSHLIDAFNLSDIFDHMSQTAADAVFQKVGCTAAPGARVLYWRLRSAAKPPMEVGLELLEELSGELYARTKTPTYEGISLYAAAS